MRAKVERYGEVRVLVAMLAVVIVVELFCTLVPGTDRAHRVHLRVDGAQCTAQVDGGQRLTVSSEGAPGGDGIGFYTFHGRDYQPMRQYLRHFDVITADAHTPTGFLLLRENDPIAPHLADEDWRIEPNQGLYHVPKAGARAVLPVPDLHTRSFALTVEIAEGRDAGIVFFREGRQNGRVFVVRTIHNDAFFFDLVDGQPGPILGIIPIEDLRVHIEAARLGALIARLLARGILLVLIIKLATHLLTPWVRRRGLHLPAHPLGTAHHVAWLVAPLVFLATLALALHVARFGLHHMPHIADETAYLFQAKVFALGRLWAPSPPLPDFFAHEHLIMDSGRWFSKYPPLWSGLLALGVQLGMPWAVAPLVGACTAVAIFLLAREICDTTAALVSVFLTLSSPFFVFMIANMMSHAAAGLFATLHILFILRAVRRGGRGDYALSGMALGALILTRPYTALLVALPVGLMLAWIGLQRRVDRPFRSGMLMLAAGVYPFLLLYFPWNILHGTLGGEVPVSLYTYYSDADTLGFGPEKGFGWLKTWGSWGHTPAKALRSVWNFLEYSTGYVFGWPGSVACAFLVVGLLRVRRARHAAVLGGVCVALAAGHMLYWATQHICYGARYWYAGLPGFIALSAVGVRALMRPLRPAHPDATTAGTLVTLTVLVGLISMNLMTYMPRHFAAGRDYGNISPDLRTAIERQDLDGILVFVRTEGTLYNDGFFMNDPLLEGSRIFARDLGPRNADLAARYPHLDPYLWDKRDLQPLPFVHPPPTP